MVKETKKRSGKGIRGKRDILFPKGGGGYRKKKDVPAIKRGKGVLQKGAF